MKPSTAIILMITAMLPFQVKAAAQIDNAVKVLRSQFTQLKRQLPEDPAQGGDVGLVCQILILEDWSNRVLNTLPFSTSDSDAFRDFQSRQSQFAKELTAVRTGLVQNVKNAIQEGINTKTWPAAPSDLSFATFSQHSMTYLNSLSNCGNSEFIAKIQELVAPVDPTQQLTAKIEIARNRNPDLPAGIATSGEQNAIVVTKTASYEQWLRMMFADNLH